MLTYFTRIMSAMVAPAEPAYTTIIYPTKDVPVVVHDGLGITQERPWYRLPVVEQEEACHEPFDDDLVGRRALFEGSEIGLGFADVLDDLVPTITGFASDIGDFLVDLESPFSAGNSASGFSLFDGIGSFDNAGFMDSSELLGVNPASGLPMMDSCFDVGGNPFGMS